MAKHQETTSRSRSRGGGGDGDGDGDGPRLCARGAWCAGYRLVPQPGGTPQRAPGFTWQAFCAADTTLIGSQLAELPSAWHRLHQGIGDPYRRGVLARVPFGPRIPLSEYYDMLMRRLVFTLCSWEERVRTVWKLSPLDTRRSALRDGGKAVTQACRVLAQPQRLSTLLALPPEPMFRFIPAGELGAEEWQHMTVIYQRDGMAGVLGDLGGAHAGLEILGLHRRCLAALGEAATQPEILDGVPCRSCGRIGLERAEPPPDPGQEPDWSRCPDPSCGDRMTLGTYRAWVRRYEAWATSLGPLTCRRCEKGDCGQCVYPGCECKTAGHPNAALTRA